MKHADISSIYDRGNYKRKGSHPQSDTITRLKGAMVRFGAREKDINQLREMQRGGTLNSSSLLRGVACVGTTDDPDLIVQMYSHFSRAVAALNNVKALGEWYILPHRAPVDPSNKFTIKVNTRTIKSFAKPGVVTGFTVTKL